MFSETNKIPDKGRMENIYTYILTRAWFHLYNMLSALRVTSAALKLGSTVSRSIHQFCLNLLSYKISVWQLEELVTLGKCSCPVVRYPSAAVQLSAVL